MLTRKVPRCNADLPEQLRAFPKFQDEVLQANLRLTEEVEKLAMAKGCTVAQVAIAWVRGMSGRHGVGVVVPIPGATTVERVVENCKQVELTEEEMGELDGILERNEVVGGRYGGALAEMCEG